MQLRNSLDKHLKIRKSIEDSIKLKSAILNDNIIQDAISEIIEKADSFLFAMLTMEVLRERLVFVAMKV